MPRPAHLRLIVPPEPARAPSRCATADCPLPAARGDRLCGLCAFVHRGARELSRRLLARDLARLECRSPGLAEAAIAALASLVVVRTPAPELPDVVSPSWPDEGDLVALKALVVELEHGAARA
ncbi:hypothetical protein OM076_38855 [Solirubrobacter ginsenosidimutans]|uniref:Uncharacterized protein n=1 Tax=Solirubrobacter ginsenosidimutans TaxID=490573 RepID=A0A9X3S422_9ACTN|nr:hypothetical protein [Solirubrobacter ginsenosidimutans]MDA0166290.1 hypothetical protein [Solirubrobacter ginsenosidimutans]